MKKAPLIGIVSFVCIALLAVSGCGSGATLSSSPDQPVVMVNGSEITKSQVDEKIHAIKCENHIQSDDDWHTFLLQNDLTEEKVTTSVVDSLIVSSLVRQEAEKRNLEVDPDYIDEQIITLKSNYPDDEAWENALKTSGYTEASYREAVEDSLLMQRLREDIVDKTEPTQEQIEEYCAAVAPRLKGKKSSHILFKKSDKKLAEKVRADLVRGVDFKRMVREHSIDGSRKDDGNVGWDCVATFVPEYQEALDKLQVGEISPVVESQYGYHIIKCTDSFNPEIYNPVTSADYPDDLLKFVIGVFKRDLATQQFEMYLNKLESNATIEFVDKSVRVSENDKFAKLQKPEVSEEEANAPLAAADPHQPTEQGEPDTTGVAEEKPEEMSQTQVIAEAAQAMNKSLQPSATFDDASIEETAAHIVIERERALSKKFLENHEDDK